MHRPRPEVEESEEGMPAPGPELSSFRPSYPEQRLLLCFPDERWPGWSFTRPYDGMLQHGMLHGLMQTATHACRPSPGSSSVVAERTGQMCEGFRYPAAHAMLLPPPQIRCLATELQMLLQVS